MKFRRKRRTEHETGGEDAFLDIVANLVGILVILVMVIGVRAKDAWVASSSAATVTVEAPTEKSLDPQLLARRAKVISEHQSLDQNVREVELKTEEMGALVEIRQQERQQLQVLLTAARQELDGRLEKLDAIKQTEVASATEIRELEAELERLMQQRQAIEASGNQPIELEHLPTPLAKTVFGNEEHFRLKHGKISYVPLNELTEMLRSHAPTQVHRLTQVAEISETLGPVQGFHLTYIMHRRNVETETRVGPVTRQVAELKQFVLIPMEDQIGESIDEALAAGSQFQQMVDAFRPGATVVTVWTYPDSFSEYRELKEWLHVRGFASAARPLPDGQPISGSPRGSRSAAQ